MEQSLVDDSTWLPRPVIVGFAKPTEGLRFHFCKLHQADNILSGRSRLSIDRGDLLMSHTVLILLKW